MMAAMPRPASAPRAARFMSIEVKGGLCHDLPVVEADTGNVERDFQPLLTQSVRGNPGNVFVAAEKGIGVGYSAVVADSDGGATKAFGPSAVKDRE